MDKYDYNALKFYLDMAQWVATLLLGVFMWVDKRRRDNTSGIDKLNSNHTALERRVVTVEEHLRHAPTHEDISALREQNAALQSKLDRVTNTLDRIHDYLMNKDRK
jgi:hypothetical protein